MMNARLTPHCPSQSHAGIGARLIRRIGGAVRNAIAGRLVLAGVLRRPTASPSCIGRTVAGNADARPASGPTHATRRPRATKTVPPSSPARSACLARLLFRRRRAAWPIPPLLRDDNDAPFTPEECPGLSPELCTILNTPLEEIDPDTLRVLLAAFARTITDIMPPAAGMMDAHKLFSALYDRFATALDAAMPDAPPQEAPATRVEPLPNMPLAPVPPPEAQTATLRDAAPHNPPLAATAAHQTAPDRPSPPGPRFHAGGPALDHANSFRVRGKQALRQCRSFAPYHRALFCRRPLPHVRPPQWHYAARASPS